MTLLVTGASSFVGAELIRQCRAAGIRVVGLDRAPPAEACDEFIEADIRDPDLAKRLPGGIDAVVHLAAIARDSDCRRDPVACFDVNVTGTANLFRAMVERNISRLIFASSEWVYDRFDPGIAKTEDTPIDALALTSEYALSKLAGEALLKQQQARHPEIAVTVLRFGIIYGPRHDNWSAVEALLAKVAEGGNVVVGSARTARGFLHVGDIARAILAARDRTGFEVFNIQPDRPITLREVVETAAGLLGHECRLVESDPDHPSIRNVSGVLASQSLGWRAETDLEAGLRDVAQFLGLLPAKPVESPDA
ncbi:NAD-dependent epimerase/dehydratase family protein [Jiella marina]|uniref:NAD-dependent epimerase/dehydratase family protein n=1 Tax=Jiella sp. LLJ827 TaxID=2917712 RepID=UPI002100FDAD|nr:NAD(P)-dependent oxidoreductase [Jiella sp. LLJ827]MCQ0987996.1 NAD(P)-dependent oxidoreductase [Jiella sp. LLJ827]